MKRYEDNRTDLNLWFQGAPLPEIDRSPFGDAYTPCLTLEVSDSAKIVVNLNGIHELRKALDSAEDILLDAMAPKPRLGTSFYYDNVVWEVNAVMPDSYQAEIIGSVWEDDLGVCRLFTEDEIMSATDLEI